MTDLEDLFESSLFLDSKDKDKDQDSDHTQSIDLRALNLTRDMLRFGFEKITEIDREMIDAIES